MSTNGWYLMSDDPHNGIRRWGLDLEDKTVIRTEYYMAVPFMEANRTQYNESIGQKFGNGMRHVASIPMHVWAREIAPRQQQQDENSIKKWLNDPENVAFRTFRGKV